MDASRLKGPITIIDIGTNTFEYLIARYNSESFKVLADGKIPVWLGRGGMVDGKIAEDAFERAEEALSEIRLVSLKHGSKRSIGVATSASRGADNTNDLYDLAEEYGVELRIIEGEEEAELIQAGASMGLPSNFPDHLIMDIGGGSTEFILVKDNEVKWKQSFNVGVTRLLEQMTPSDPLSPTDIDRLRLHFRAMFKPVRQEVGQHPVAVLMGSAGSFDSLVEMLFEADKIESKEGLVGIPIRGFQELDHQLRMSTLEQRKMIPGLVNMRTSTMHLGTMMIAEILDLTGISEVVRTPFALREGVLKRLMEGSIS